jgi:hypothetical protein
VPISRPHCKAACGRTSISSWFAILKLRQLLRSTDNELADVSVSLLQNRFVILHGHSDSIRSSHLQRLTICVALHRRSMFTSSPVCQLVCKIYDIKSQAIKLHSIIRGQINYKHDFFRDVWKNGCDSFKGVTHRALSQESQERGWLQSITCRMMLA